MIATNQCNAIRVAYFESQQQQKSFDRIKTTVYKITHEQIVGVRAIVTHFEQFFQIIELTMNVTTNLENGTRQKSLRCRRFKKKKEDIKNEVGLKFVV